MKTDQSHFWKTYLILISKQHPTSNEAEHNAYLALTLTLTTIVNRIAMKVEQKSILLILLHRMIRLKSFKHMDNVNVAHRDLELSSKGFEAAIQEKCK